MCKDNPSYTTAVDKISEMVESLFLEMFRRLKILHPGFFVICLDVSNLEAFSSNARKNA